MKNCLSRQIVPDCTVYSSDKQYSTIYVSRLKSDDRIIVHMNITVHDHQCKRMRMWVSTRGHCTL